MVTPIDLEIVLGEEYIPFLRGYYLQLIKDESKLGSGKVEMKDEEVKEFITQIFGLVCDYYKGKGDTEKEMALERLVDPAFSDEKFNKKLFRIVGASLSGLIRGWYMRKQKERINEEIRETKRALGVSSEEETGETQKSSLWGSNNNRDKGDKIRFGSVAETTSGGLLRTTESTDGVDDGTEWETS